MNDRNPKCRSMVREGETYGGCRAAAAREGALVRSGRCSGQGWCSSRRLTAATEVEGSGVARMKMKRRGTRGKLERPPGPIYKEINDRCENRGAGFLDKVMLSPRLSEAR